MRNRATSRLAGGIVLFLNSLLTVQAGSMQVSPVRVELSAAKPLIALSVRNTGAEPLVIQLEMMDWSQQGGKDVYTPTRDILAAPPIFTVPPGKSQVVRLGVRRPADSERELSYRLFLQEVPPPRLGFQGIQMAVRFGVPVFVAPASAATAAQPTALSWQVYRTADGTLETSLTNNGSHHVRLTNLKLSTSNGREVILLQGVGYVLPGQSHHWTAQELETPPGDLVHISAATGAGVLNAGAVVVESQK
jgi:fimbrial chaperone protein